MKKKSKIRWIVGGTASVVLAAGAILHGTANASTITGNCGSGYSYVTAKSLGAYGQVKLYRNGSTYCAVTNATGAAYGVKKEMWAGIRLESGGSFYSEDHGSYKYYAGPWKDKKLAGTCVVAAGGVVYRGKIYQGETGCV